MSILRPKTTPQDGSKAPENGKYGTSELCVSTINEKRSPPLPVCISQRTVLRLRDCHCETLSLQGTTCDAMISCCWFFFSLVGPISHTTQLFCLKNQTAEGSEILSKEPTAVAITLYFYDNPFPCFSRVGDSPQGSTLQFIFRFARVRCVCFVARRAWLMLFRQCCWSCSRAGSAPGLSFSTWSFDQTFSPSLV